MSAKKSKLGSKVLFELDMLDGRTADKRRKKSTRNDILSKVSSIEFNLFNIS